MADKWTPEQWALVGSGIATIFTGVGVLLNKAIDAWIKYRKRRIEDSVDVQMIEGTDRKFERDIMLASIKKQDKEIENLSSRIEALQLSHQECLKQHARVEAINEYLQQQVKSLTGQINAYRIELRGLRYPSPLQKEESEKVDNGNDSAESQ